ncbi:MAG: hypothetical protein ACPG7F_00495 [Aggregatilineales bacterium]
MASLPTRQRYNLNARQRRFRNKQVRLTQYEYGLLGNGAGLVMVPNTNGNRAYFRPVAGVNDAGFSTYGSAQRLPLRAGFMSPVYDGAPVVVGFDTLTGRRAILAEDTVGIENAGLSAGANNPNIPERQWVRKRSIQDFISLPVGTATTPSLKVQVGAYPYFHYGTLQFFPGTGVSTHVDLTSYVPAAAQHRVAIVWGDTFSNGYSVTASTAKDIDDPIDSDDYDECVSQADAEAMPIRAYHLKNNQSAVTAEHLDNDLRQLWNVPQVYGFPTVLSSRKLRIRDGHQGLVKGNMTIAAGAALIVQAGGEMMIL